jgi:hypothetical protein
MKLSTLALLFSGQMSVEDFSAEIQGELAVHSRELAKLGGSAPVQVAEDADLIVDRASLGVLCRLFASGQLSASELAYTADVLQLSDRVDFASQDIATDLAECTDPEINGPLSVARALEIAGNGAAA